MLFAFKQSLFRPYLRTVVRLSFVMMLFAVPIQQSPAATQFQFENAIASTLQNNPPAISDFTATALTNNLWIFSGTVTDENPGECIIAFGGILDGRSVQVEEDGTFSYTVELPPDTNGGVSATAIDEDDLESMSAQSFIF